MKLLPRMGLATLILLVGAAGGGAQDPSPTPTTVDRLSWATGEFDKAERTMLAAYMKLRSAVDDTGKERLERAQQNWTQFRDANAAFLCFQLAGGPFERLEYLEARRRETEKRTKELNELYKTIRERYLQNQ